MGVLFDIILLTLLVISIIIGYRRGLVKSVWKIVALVVTIVLVMALKSTAVSLLSESRFANTVHTKISENINMPEGGGVNIAENLNLPEFMQDTVNDGITAGEEAAGTVSDAATDALTNVIITIVACVSLFIIIRLILMALRMVMNVVTKVPGIKSVNRLLGALLGAVNMVFIIFLLLAVMSIFAPADSNMSDAVNNSYIVKYFYNYNILLQLFMKI